MDARFNDRKTFFGVSFDTLRFLYVSYRTLLIQESIVPVSERGFPVCCLGFMREIAWAFSFTWSRSSLFVVWVWFWTDLDGSLLWVLRILLFFVLGLQHRASNMRLWQKTAHPMQAA